MQCSLKEVWHLFKVYGNILAYTVSIISPRSLEYIYIYVNFKSLFISDIFVGQLKSELKFDECNHRSVTFDPFWDLSLPVSRVSIGIDSTQTVN